MQSATTRCPQIFATLHDDTPRHTSSTDQHYDEETPCFNNAQLLDAASGSLKKVRKSIPLPRSRNKPERLTFPSVESDKHVSFDSAEPFSDISTRLATDVTVEQFKNAHSRCAFTPLPVEQEIKAEEEEEDQLNLIQQHTSEKRKRDHEVARIIANSNKTDTRQNKNSGRNSSSSSQLKPKLLSKLESILTYNAKMYRERVQKKKPAPVVSGMGSVVQCFSACEDRGSGMSWGVDGSLNLGKPPKHPALNGIPTPVNMSIAADKSLNLSHISPKPMDFSNVSSVRRGSECSFQVNMSTSHLKPPHISCFSQASHVTSNSNLTCFAKTEITRQNRKDLFVTSLFPRSHRYLEEKQKNHMSFEEASRSVSNNQTRLDKASSFLNSVRILGAESFQSVKPGRGGKHKSNKEIQSASRSVKTLESRVKKQPRVSEATFVQKRRKEEGAPSLSSIDIQQHWQPQDQNKSFVFETTSKRRYGSFNKDLEKNYDPQSILNQLKNINTEGDFFLHKPPPHQGRGQAIRASLRDIRPSQKSSARARSDNQFASQGGKECPADRSILNEIEGVIEKREHRRNASMKGEKFTRSEREIREENKSQLCKSAQRKKYIFARQQGYKEGHIRSELSSQREKEEIKKYLEDREKLRAQKDLLKWEASHDSLPAVVDKENISPNFNKAIGLLKKKKKDRRLSRAAQLEESSSKKNRKSLGRLFPAMKIDKYKVEFGSEAKDALKERQEQRLRETGVESRARVGDLMDLCEDTLKRRLGKEFRKKSMEKEIKYLKQQAY